MLKDYFIKTGPTIDTFELPCAAGVVELGAVEHVPHAVGLLVVLAAVGGIQALHKLVFFPSLGAGEDITTLTVALTNLEESTLEKMIKLEIFESLNFLPELSLHVFPSTRLAARRASRQSWRTRPCMFSWLLTRI